MCVERHHQPRPRVKCSWRFLRYVCLLLACSFWGARKAEAATKMKTRRMDVNIWWGKTDPLTLFFFTLHNRCHHLTLAASEPMSQSGISERCAFHREPFQDLLEADSCPRGRVPDGPAPATSPGPPYVQCRDAGRGSST